MPKWNSIQRGVTENMPEKPGTPVWACAVSRSLRGWLVGAGMGGKTQSRLSLRSHIHIPHNTPPFAAAFGQGHNHYHHHNHHHHRSSLSLSSVYMGHHRWNRCIKYFVCSDGKLHWNTNLQIQIDVALCQRSGHSDQSSPRHSTGEASRLGWAGQGIGHYKGFTRGGGSEIFGCLSMCVCVLKIRKLRDCIRQRKGARIVGM